MEEQNVKKKMFTCKYCKSTFEMKGLLFSHIKIVHKNEIKKPFNCRRCDKSFTREYSKHKHYEICYKKYACHDITCYYNFHDLCNNDCGKRCRETFKFKKDLNKHIEDNLDGHNLSSFEYYQDSCDYRLIFKGKKLNVWYPEK